MATKKVTTKKTPRKNLQVVDAAKPEASAETAAPAEEKIPTGRELLEQALEFAQKAIDAFHLCVDHLNDAGEAGFYDTIEPVEHRKAVLEALRNYVEKSDFALPSLRDEIKVALSKESTPKQPDLPKFDFPVPQVPITAVFSDKPTAEDIKGARDTVALACQYIAQSQIQAFEAERMLRVTTFLTTFHKNLADLAQRQAA